jgi:hypothetical protein
MQQDLKEGFNCGLVMLSCKPPVSADRRELLEKRLISIMFLHSEQILQEIFIW